ncbi:MAG: flagellar motor protein MotB, partial [Odoribacter sp.]|nr:flagellar motor protein MotB [Odoribacter sp.]
FLKHIDKERMSYRGYGKSRPLVPNDTEEGRAKNRRTEIRIQ